MIIRYAYILKGEPFDFAAVKHDEVDLRTVFFQKNTDAWKKVAYIASQLGRTLLGIKRYPCKVEDARS